MPRPSVKALACPTCDYDLSGTLGKVCPECGGAFDRQQLILAASSEPDTSSANTLLIAAVFGGMIAYGFGPSARATAIQLLWAAGVWAIALTWVALRRRALRDRPQLALWIVAVAVVAAGRPDLSPPFSTAVEYISLAAGAGAVAYAFGRTARRSVPVILRVIAFVLWWAAFVYLAGALSSALGYSRGETFYIFGVAFPAAGVNDAIAAAAGLVLAVLGWGLWYGAGRLAALLSPVGPEFRD